MKKIILAALLVASVGGSAQGVLGNLKEKAGGKGGKTELYEEEKITVPAYANNIGKIVFSNEELDRELPETKYTKSYTFGDKLSMRAWLANSPANSMLLQLAESGKKPKEINENKGSFDGQTIVLYVLYLDGQRIINTSYGWNFNGKDMIGTPTVRGDFNDGTDKNFFGESLYADLLKKPELLTPGVHKLKLELVPVKTAGYGSDFPYKPLAVGEIDMTVPAELKVTEADCFPKKKMSDPKLEAEILKATKNFFKDGAPNTFKVIVTEPNFIIIRDEYNSIIKKKIMAAVVTKNKDGVWVDYYVYEKVFNGTGYEPAIMSPDPTFDGRMASSGKKVNPGCLKFLK